MGLKICVHKLVNIIAVAAALSGAAISFAVGGGQAIADEPFSLRGIKMGITLEEFRLIPFPKHPDPKQFSYSDVRVMCTGDHGLKDAWGGSDMKVSGSSAAIGLIRCGYFGFRNGVPELGLTEASLSVAGVAVGHAFEFLAEKDNPTTHRLFRIAIPSNMDYWDQFWGAYTKKFGQPTSIEEGAVQNANGATFPKIMATWSNSNSSITLEQRTSRINHMEITYLNVELMQEYLERIKSVKGDPVSDL